MRRWIVVSQFAVMGLALVCASGCMATRSWVREQLSPVAGRLGAVDQRVAQVDRRVDQVDAKTNQALGALHNLRLEKKLVLGMNEGATFGLNSSALSRKAKGEIDRFLKEYEERMGPGSDALAERLFVIAGHADVTGKADYNYQLGQRRAERVAGYLVAEKGIDPMHVQVVSYGAVKPVGNNKTLAGRRENRRIEILVFQEKIDAGGETSSSAAR
jgi:outer membrane protein OmpA-like peptidoglycan-associated protein